MITTSNGTYGATNSPFMSRPWTWGYTGVMTDQSRDGKTLLVGTIPEANVQTQSFTYMG